MLFMSNLMKLEKAIRWKERSGKILMRNRERQRSSKACHHHAKDKEMKTDEDHRKSSK